MGVLRFRKESTLIHAIAIGNLGQDPEMKYTESGDAVTNISIATRTHRKDSDGKYLPEWVRVTAWRDLAELINRHCHKGDRVAVTGSVELEKWSSETKGRQASIKVIATGIEFLNVAKKTEEESASPTEEPPW